MSIEVHSFCFYCEEYTRLISLNFLSHVKSKVFVRVRRAVTEAHIICVDSCQSIFYHGHEKLVTLLQGDLSVDG